MAMPGNCYWPLCPKKGHRLFAYHDYGYCEEHWAAHNAWELTRRMESLTQFCMGLYLHDLDAHARHEQHWWDKYLADQKEMEQELERRNEMIAGEYVAELRTDELRERQRWFEWLDELRNQAKIWDRVLTAWWGSIKYELRKERTRELSAWTRWKDATYDELDDLKRLLGASEESVSFTAEGGILDVADTFRRLAGDGVFVSTW